jgi:hypothetical protein
MKEIYWLIFLRRAVCPQSGRQNEEKDDEHNKTIKEYVCCLHARST